VDLASMQHALEDAVALISAGSKASA